MRKPRHLWEAWPEFAGACLRARRAALLTDFDGTLAPIRRRADAVRLPRSVARTLASLVQKGVLVGVISGRSFSDICARVPIRQAWVAGAHGFFLRGPGNRTFSSLNRSQERKMMRVARRLATACSGLRGIRVEDKTAAVAVHYRQAGAGAARRAAAAVAAVLSSERGLRRMDGKKVWEVLPATGADKWQAARRILRRARWPRHGGLVVYLGDDTTDESVFRKLTGFTVAVGRRRRTAAGYCLESPAEVRRFLERWNKLLT